MAAVTSKVVSRAIGATARAAHSAAAKGDHYRVLVVGGGAGGISVASSFAKSMEGDVAIIEPSSTHW
jgi:sulfide:quinone oxidoreductase